MTTSIILSDDNTDDLVITAGSKSEALRKLYDELASRNRDDCSTAIDAGQIAAFGAAYLHMLSLEFEPEEFWASCVAHILADSQDWHYGD